jgi:hypothetical protein
MASQYGAEEELDCRAQEGAKDPPNDIDSIAIECNVSDDNELNALLQEEKQS